jgi:ElaB/YqjD/DUF883 family membrane-anchored ribosome-binding protein
LADEEAHRLRRQIRDAEDRIIEDIKKIPDVLTPENIATYLVSTIREQIFRRFATMNAQRINEVSDRMITDAVEAVKSHPGITALLGFGVTWFLADSMLKQRSDGRRTIAQLKEEVAQLQEETKKYAESSLPDLKESVKETGEIVARKSQAAIEQVAGYVDENPLVAGFIGLSAGLILGVLTSGILSNEGLLDETKQAVQKKTRRALHETKEKVGNVLQSARRAAREEAERHDIIQH